MAIRRDVIPAALSRCFMRYGRFVAHHPIPFLVIPLILAIGLSLGLITMETTTDIEYLYIQKDAPSFDERAKIEKIFPFNDRNKFNSVRSVRDQGYVQVLIEDKDGGNVYDEKGLSAAYEIDRIITKLDVKYKGKEHRYSDLCAAWKGQCERSSFLEFMKDQNIEEAEITFPVHITNLGRLYLTYQIGGVRVDQDTDFVKSARVIMLSYYVRYEKKEDRKHSILWLNAIRDRLFKYKSNTHKIYFRTSLSMEQEFDASVLEVINLFILTFGLLSVFGVMSMFMTDWVRAKPWVAAGALFAAAMASGSALGLLTAIGVPFTSPVGIAPFVVIGIGLDDVYILVSSWRYTPYTLPTADRVAFMLKDAAVSITITSVTDALAFGIGLISSFRSVQIFCAYVMAGVIFCYFYQLTFTLACIVLTGRREEANRHCITFKKVLPVTESGEKSALYRLFCSGGVSKYQDEKPTEDSGSFASVTVATSTTSLDDNKPDACAVKMADNFYVYKNQNNDNSAERREINYSSKGTVIVLNHANDEPTIINGKDNFAAPRENGFCYGKEVGIEDEMNSYEDDFDGSSLNIDSSDVTISKPIPFGTFGAYQSSLGECDAEKTDLPSNCNYEFQNGAVSAEFKDSQDNAIAKKSKKMKRKGNDVTNNAIHLPWLNRFLGTHFARFLMTPLTRFVVFLFYLAYIGMSIYGIFQLKEGLKIVNLVPDTSYVADFFSEYQKHISNQYGPYVQIVFDEPLDYRKHSVTKEIDYVIESYRRNQYFFRNKEFVMSWLDDFYQFLSLTSRNVEDLSNEEFINILRSEFFTYPGIDLYESDIIFDKNFTRIRASRVFIQSKGSDDAIEQRTMMLTSRDIVTGSRYDVTSFALTFPFYDMFVVILPITLQSLGFAVAAMFVVSLVFIPSLTTVILVTLATVSIEIGVIGFMALWGVYLDAVSMINLIMSIGFSVDFAAHISYHYIISKNRDPVQSAGNALGHLGVPIILAALSTILAVVALSMSVSYVFRTFFKIVTLIMLFGFFHAMFLLPVFLSTVKSIMRKKAKKVSENCTQT